MYLVNLVYDDEELLEPYEWQRDDTYIEYDDLPENTEDPEDNYVYNEEPEQESLSLFD